AARRALGLPPEIRRQTIPTALARLLHQGSYPGRLCALAPDAVGVLGDDADPSVPLDAGALTRELLQAMRDTDPDEAIGHLRTREYLRIARREVASAPLERVGADLSALVAACVQALLEHAGVADQVAVFGMGKLGGHELNFLSDIDLLLVHSDELGGTEQEDRSAVIALHTTLRTLVRRLEGVGKWRPVFRVDLRLRPFGSRGPLSMSVSATEAYYERHGRPWERQAWLRGRRIAGSEALGDALEHRLRPFIYPRSIDASIFEEVAQLMARARRQAPANAGVPGGIDLKLDEGGIRTVEFAVQALQLMHAGRNPSLRSPSTMRTLDRLLVAGLISDREHGELLDAYRFFRRVEHRLQLAEGGQTHTIPADETARRLLAARLGISPDPGPSTQDSTDPLPAFDRLMASHRARATAIAATMSGDSDVAVAAPITVILDSGAPEALRRDALATVGFRDPGEAEGLLSHLFARENAALNARGAAGRGAARLLTACLDSADPDMALVRFARFSRDRPAHYGVWRSFAEPDSPGWDLPRLTAELFGTSEALSAGLIGFPVGRGALPDDTIAVLRAAARHPLDDTSALGAAMASAPDDPRGLDATLLRFKHQQLVRIGIHDLGRRRDPLQIGRALADLADRVVRTVIRDLVAEPSLHGGPWFDLAVLAIGKYGAQAMDYGSDLDLVFVYAPANNPAAQGSGAEVGPAATRFAQRLIQRLSNRALGIRLYEIDTRLRPSGRQGLLVTSQAAFDRYHRRALPVWEKLAMLRMRSVAEVSVGPRYVSPDLSPEFTAGPGVTVAAAVAGQLAAHAEATVAAHLFPDAPAGPNESVSLAALGAAVGQLKRRIEGELAREDRQHINAKTGAGGSLELELLVSALQLRHGGAHRSVRARGIDAAIVALGAMGGLPQPVAATLRTNYGFQRLLLNRLRMMHSGGHADPDRFSVYSPRLPTLARRMGLPDADALLVQYRKCRATVRDALRAALPDSGLPSLD
ncbi:MAG: hypothetical protein JKY37_20145, partial [Nannocystaceae bacterium]|nr:hypothetical protein [Nannocystaceae bacterium]